MVWNNLITTRTSHLFTQFCWAKTWINVENKCLVQLSHKMLTTQTSLATAWKDPICAHPNQTQVDGGIFSFLFPQTNPSNIHVHKHTSSLLPGDYLL